MPMQNVSTLTIHQLQEVTDRYPWFTVARKRLACLSADEGISPIESIAANTGLFVLSRRQLVRELKDPACRYIPEPEASPKDSQIYEAPPQRTYILGGDYFSKEDFKELELSGEAFNVEELKYNPIGAALSSMPDDIPAARMQECGKNLNPEDFCTETLAGIYAQQGLYDRARAIYEKLILLYPEKSAYFVSLIEKINKQIS